MLRKGAIKQVKSEPAKFVLSKQKGWKSLTFNKSQISEQFDNLPTFLNGWDAFNKESCPRTQLFDKDRSKSFLFWHTSRQKLKEIYQFSMGKKFIRIPLLIMWPVFSPDNFHKTSEEPNCAL